VYCSSFIGTEAVSLNALCRSCGVNFILCAVSGLVGVVFEDLGEFTTEMNSGRNREDIPIKELKLDGKDGTWVVSLSSINRTSHGIELSSLIRFTGITELQQSEPFVVTKCDFQGEEGAFLIDKQLDVVPVFATSRPFAEVVFSEKTFQCVCMPYSNYLY
jgi:hypothetical protein